MFNLIQRMQILLFLKSRIQYFSFCDELSIQESIVFPANSLPVQQQQYLKSLEECDYR